MPTAYFTVTTKKVKDLISKNDITGLEKYLVQEQDFSNTEPTSSRIVAPWVECRDTVEEKEYHILSHAVDVANTTVLKHFAHLINLDYQPDGNAYHLLHLAVENYVSDHTNPDRLETIRILCTSQLKNGGSSSVGSALRPLIGFIDEYDNFDAADIIVRDYGGSVWDLYHYSIAWGHRKVLDEVVRNYGDLIDFKWTTSAIEIAARFGKHDMVGYAKRYLKKT